MKQGVKRYLRAAQTHFPFVLPLKFGTYNACTKRLGMFMDRDFRALARLQPVGLALDIGGNWGQSVHALKFCCKPRQIVTFEPNSELAGRLHKRFARDRSVEVETCALSHEEGTFRFYIPRYRNFLFDGLSSLDKTEAYGWLNERRMARFDASKLRIEEHEVPVKKLDDYNLAPDVVKIDVQGAEHAVVRGGIRTFRTYRPATIVESPSAELIGEFAAFGMAPYYFDGRTLKAHKGRWKNSIFLTQEQASRVAGYRTLVS